MNNLCFQPSILLRERSESKSPCFSALHSLVIRGETVWIVAIANASAARVLDRRFHKLAAHN